MIAATERSDIELLSLEDNELLTRVGPGTAMGSVLRRFWMPAVLSRELLADEEPVRLCILGEDLLAFRDSTGRVGIVEPYCSHKLAPLFFARNEECGLRCVYHGWKFDVTGACIELPNVDAAAGERMKRNVGILSYPVREAGGLVWVFMGNADRVPDLPDLEWLSLPPENVHVSRWLQKTNYAQGLEGDLDSSHVSFLHRITGDGRLSLLEPIVKDAMNRDGAPVLQTKDTDFGLTYGARRTTSDGRYYWRIAHWLMPVFTLTAGGSGTHSGRAWVPVDDENVMTFNYAFRTDGAITEDQHAMIERGDHFPPLTRRTTVELSAGWIIDANVPQANGANDYEIDRVAQRSVNFTGIRGTNDQDRALQENMRSVPGVARGRIVDRSREHLVSSDSAATLLRRKLLRLAKSSHNQSEGGVETPVPRYDVRSFSRLTDIDSLDALLTVEQGSVATVPA